MTPVESEFKRHDPEAGVIGDCFRACIASVLDLPRESVPHFSATDDGKGLRAAGDASAEVAKFLRSHGLALVELPFDHNNLLPDGFVEHIGTAYFGEVHWLLLAMSRRGFPHNVVCKGGRIVHDPTYGAEHGLTGPVNGYYWAAWIVRP